MCAECTAVKPTSGVNAFYHHHHYISLKQHRLHQTCTSLNGSQQADSTLKCIYLDAEYLNTGSKLSIYSHEIKVSTSTILLSVVYIFTHRLIILHSSAYSICYQPNNCLNLFNCFLCCRKSYFYSFMNFWFRIFVRI